jgi:hypothetical protein
MRIQKLGPVWTYSRDRELRDWSGMTQVLPRIYSASFSSHFFLCLAGRLRLSAITRVAEGAIPELRAARRASTPTSRTFFLRRFIVAVRQSPPQAA